MKIVENEITLDELRQIANAMFGNFVKAVVDIEKGLLAIDAELHSDLEAILLETGSKVQNLWGINLYPDLAGDGFVEFDAMINVRPNQKNNSRGVEDAAVRAKILDIVESKVAL
jgi:hypothetical protein